MGRPEKRPDTKKVKRIFTYVSPAEKEEFSRRLEADSLTAAEFLRFFITAYLSSDNLNDLVDIVRRPKGSVPTDKVAGQSGHPNEIHQSLREVDSHGGLQNSGSLGAVPTDSNSKLPSQNAGQYQLDDDLSGNTEIPFTRGQQMKHCLKEVQDSLPHTTFSYWMRDLQGGLRYRDKEFLTFNLFEPEPLTITFGQNAPYKAGFTTNADFYFEIFRDFAEFYDKQFLKLPRSSEGKGRQR